MEVRYLLIFFILLMPAALHAQNGRTVSGLVKDTTGQTLPGSVIRLLTDKDSTSTTTDANGRFTFQGVTAPQFSLVVISLGYQPIKRRIVLDKDNKPVMLAPIILKASSTMLNTVNITDVNPIKLKEDTIEYNADAYKVRDNAPVEDVIRKLPGVDVDASGNITAQGKQVTKVRVNGKDFFGGDVQTATKNIPADLVQSIQVIDDYGDQANVNGFKTGDPVKVLNINIKPSKNFGYFGQASAGDGTDDIPQHGDVQDQNRYVAQANLFSFNGDRQIAFLGNYNNTNTNLFNFGGPGGGRGPGGPPGSNSGSGNGITTARTFGLNYRDTWGKHISVYGSYSFADNTVNTLSSTIQNNISLSNPSTNTQKSNEQDTKLNHRFTFNIEYKPDTVNYFKFTPTYAYASVKTMQTGSNNLSQLTDTITNYNFSTISRTATPQYGLNVLYNHRFNRKGRNFSIYVGSAAYSTNQYQNPVYTYLKGVANAPVNQVITTNSHTDSIGTTLSYIEPLSKLSFVEFNYNYHYAYNTADKLTDTLTNTGASNDYALLSNNYNYTFTFNRFGVNYRFIEKKYNYTLGIAAQPSVLEGSSPVSAPTHVNTFNVSPVARFIYNFSRTQSLSINYSGASNQPLYSELQPVTDFSNASYPVEGNPNLKPEYNNTLTIRYNKFDFASGNVFFSNLNFVQTDDKIVANTVTYPKVYTPDPKLAGTILTQYQNAAGYTSTSAFYLFAKPWDKRKYTLFVNGNLSYNNNISYITNVDSVTYASQTEKNISKNLVYTQGLRFRVDLTDIIDAEANTSYSVNHSTNSIAQANVNNNFRTIMLGVNGKNYLWKDWTLSYDYTKTIYQGYIGATNPNVFNTYVERRFLKNNMATIRLSALDVFNQNTGFTSTQNGSYITQTNANKLGRYYLLTFTMRLQKFAGKRPDGPPGGFRPGGGPPGMGGPPPGGGPSDSTSASN